MNEIVIGIGWHRPKLIDLTVGIVSAYVSKNCVPQATLPILLSSVHAALSNLDVSPPIVDTSENKPSPDQIRNSITAEALISFINGKPYKTLKRHLGLAGMSISQYRERYDLPPDYPSTAPAYSERRSELARIGGLGQHRRVVSRVDTEIGGEDDETVSRGEIRKNRKSTGVSTSQAQQTGKDRNV